VIGVIKLSYSKLEVNFWRLLHVFESEIRVEIVRLLLQFEWRSLSDISKKLERDFGWKISLPGLLKHMRELEDAGIVRHESGIFAEKPDARKTIYLLEGKERVERILQHLQNNVGNLLLAGVIFNETTKLVRKFQGMGTRLAEDERKRLESLLAQCESEEVYTFLTEDEKKKVRLWRMMIAFI
jgi:DNA-binding transcriptional ArsR family regulator